MSSYRVFYSPYYYADIGENHVFPIRKFEIVRDRLLKEKTLSPGEIIEPQPARVEDVLLVHTEECDSAASRDFDIEGNSPSRTSLVEIARPAFVSGLFGNN